MSRVTDKQAEVFAAYRGQGTNTVWYDLDPLLAEVRDEVTGEEYMEYEWLRDLAADLIEARKELAAERDRCARLVCDLCQQDVPADTNRDGHYIHHLYGGSWTTCSADAIRRGVTP